MAVYKILDVLNRAIASGNHFHQLNLKWNACLIGMAGLHGLGEGVVDFEDSAFGLGDDFAEVLPVQVKM
jgi:hypothetical protein